MGLVLPISQIEPLNAKLATFQKYIDETVTSLRNGDPEAKKQVSGLQKSVSNFLQDGQSAYGQLLNSHKNAVATSTDPKNTPGMASMVIFYFKEVQEAIKLVKGIVKLVVGLLSISSLLAYFMADLIAMQQYLNTRLLWLKRALLRVQQKLQKKIIEWPRRLVTAKLRILYLAGQQKVYKLALEQIKANQPAKSPPVPGVNGSYFEGEFVYFDKPLNTSIINALAGNDTVTGSGNTLLATNTAAADAASAAANAGNELVTNQIKALETQLTTIEADLQDANDEIDKFIPADKAYWEAEWKKQEDKDREDLLSNFPTPGF